MKHGARLTLPIHRLPRVLTLVLSLNVLDGYQAYVNVGSLVA